MDELSEHTVAADPFAEFAAWYAEARAAHGDDADAMVVASADATGAPSARVVLLRGHDERGFCFFTNYESRKGRELTENPRGAIVLHWPGLRRQVRATGVVERVSDDRVRRLLAPTAGGEPVQRVGVAPEPTGRGSRRRSRPPLPRRRPASPAPTWTVPTSGAGSAWCPTRSSSGCTATTVSTTGCEYRRVDRTAPWTITSAPAVVAGVDRDVRHVGHRDRNTNRVGAGFGCVATGTPLPVPDLEAPLSPWGASVASGLGRAARPRAASVGGAVVDREGLATGHRLDAGRTS